MEFTGQETTLVSRFTESTFKQLTKRGLQSFSSKTRTANALHVASRATWAVAVYAVRLSIRHVVDQRLLNSDLYVPTAVLIHRGILQLPLQAAARRRSNSHGRLFLLHMRFRTFSRRPSMKKALIRYVRAVRAPVLRKARSFIASDA